MSAGGSDAANAGEAITVGQSDDELDVSSLKVPDDGYVGAVDPLDLAQSMSPYSHRTNTPFRYPMSKVVDQYLPWVVAVLGVIGVLATAHRAAGSSGWIGLSRSVLGLALFCGAIWPISLFGLKRGMEKCNLGLPPNHVFRSFACFIASYAFVYYVWAKTGNVGSMILAMMVGLGLAMALIVVLFRLDIRDLAVSLTYSATAFVLSTAAISGVVFGANLTLVNVFNFYKVANAPAHSPLAPGMSWHIVAPPPPTSQPSKTMTPDLRRASRLSSDSRRIKSIETPDLAPFDEIVHPLVASDFAAMVYRSVPDEDLILLIQFSTRTILSEIKFKHEAGARERYILSPRGDMIARIVSWPKLSAQIWSIPDSRILRNVDLTNQQGGAGASGIHIHGLFPGLLAQPRVPDGVPDADQRPHRGNRQ